MQPFLNNILSRLAEVFSPDAIGTSMANLVANAVVGLAVLLAFYVAWRLILIALRPALQRSGFDETASSFIHTLVKYGILIVGAVTALDAAQVQTSAVLASLGIVSLTIGFAARDALSNVISGILIFLDRPFVIGDLVEVEDVYGRVDRITLRSTRIVTSDGKMLAVPNTEIINKTVTSYTNFPHLRLDIPVTIAVDEDIEKARRILLDLVDARQDYLNAPQARVVVTELNDYNVTLELQAWIANEREHVEKRFELREEVFHALVEAGVEMPFETIQLAPFDVKLDHEKATTKGH